MGYARLTALSNNANKMLIKEIFIYGLVGFSTLSMLAYTIHMFIGGVVSERTEKTVMVSAVLIGATILAFLAWDIIKRRRAHRSYTARANQKND